MDFSQIKQKLDNYSQTHLLQFYDTLTVEEQQNLQRQIESIDFSLLELCKGGVQEAKKGNIQPIGGVNEKIEGFYNVCKTRGLNNEQGVIIPIQNVRNLHLSDEIIEAVKEKKFHIYAVSTIDEGIEVLTGVPAGKKNKQGKYPAGTVNYLVYEQLKQYYENSKK